MRVLFCGGGTAGHVNPAIAVAETVMRNSNDNKVAYVVTQNGIENQLVDFKKYKIDVIGLKRKLSFKNFSFFSKQIKAIKECKKIIEEFHPDIIFGTGGYATYPAIAAGHKMGIKTVLHESNAIPGKAILSLQGKADKILVNFKESEQYFKQKEKVLCVGNPLRHGFEEGTKEDARRELNIKEKYVILCTGGSLGAQRINNSAIEIIDNIVRKRKDVLFVWSTGKNDCKRVEDMLRKRGVTNEEKVIIKDYFTNISKYISAADIVISRAGAMTISELAFMKKATVLIPSPNVTNNHQYVNAKALERAGAAVLVTENVIYTLIDEIRELLDCEQKRNRLENNIHEYAAKDANKHIYSILCTLHK